MAKATGAAVVGFAFALVANLSTGELLAVIVAVDLAQFALTVEHRGRLSAVETVVDAEASGGENL